MLDARTALNEGVRVLMEQGTAVVIAVGPEVVRFRDSLGRVEEINWCDLTTVRAIKNGEVEALSQPLRPIWDALDESAKQVALHRLEVVQEILTGYRDGHPELARPGEPRSPFGEGFGVSESRRCEAMAALLGQEGQCDRALQRRVRDGEIQFSGLNPSTIRNWVRAWKKGGLAALIDGRSIRQSKSWELIDPRYRSVAQEVVDALDGDRSTVAIDELDRRIRVRLLQDGITEVRTPERRTQEYLSELTSILRAGGVGRG